MKRRDFIALTAAAAPLALCPSAFAEALAAATPSAQQLIPVRPPRKNMSAEEIREFEDAQVEEFSINSLPPEQRREAQEMAAVGSAVLMKGLLHRLDPKTYPVPRLASSPEAKAAALARGLDARAFAKLRPNLERAVREPARIQRLLGPLSSLDLRQADLRPGLGGFSRHINLKARPKPEEEEKPAPRPGNPNNRFNFMPSSSAAAYNRLHIVLRAVHCADETNPEGGADSIVLGGLLIGASGNVVAFPAVLCGDFNDGGHVYQDFGEYYLGRYNINATNGYPKSFYAIFKLVESDSDDKEVAENLTATLSLLANTILSVVASPLVGQTAGAILSAIGGFIQNVIDEDEFPPYGIRLTMTNNNPWGGPVSDKRRTNNISGHGGSYRIGYRYILNA